MIALDRSLAAYVDRVLLARDVTGDYAAKVRYCNRAFCEWLGCDPNIEGLEYESVNEFLIHLQQLGKRPDTVAGYRRAIMVVWNEAYRAGDNSNPPLRVRRIKTPRDPVEAFEQSEIRTLLNYVATLTDYFPNGVKRATFWTGAVHSAYSTALRRGDLLRVKRNQINQYGVARVRQNKTGYPIVVKFSSEALTAIDLMRVDDRALPWPYHPNALGRQFRTLAKLAGVDGQFRWLRRSSSSYAEQAEQGNGSRILGHRSQRIFHDFYEDLNITSPNPVEPPPL